MISRRTKNIKNNFGFSLIEVIVFIAIVSGLSLSVFKLSDFVLRVNLDNKMRLAAAMIAEEKIEKIRNLPYEQVGTISGIVSGVIRDDEIVENNGTFNVNTFVQYIDDSFDGLSGGDPNDENPADYKAVKVTISWMGPFHSEELVAYTNISPRGLESEIGGGILNILVFDASGLPVTDANVHVENSNIIPSVSFDALTNADGELLLIGAQASHESYEITVSKDGYSTSYTSPRTIENPNPVKPHASVTEGEETKISFSIDLLSSLTLATVRSDDENWQVNSGHSPRDHINGVVGVDSENNMYFVWQDIRGVNNTFLYIEKYSSPSVSDWGNDQKIGNSNEQFYPDIVTLGNGTSFVVWEDEHYSKQNDIYLTAVDAEGDSWEDELRVNSDLGEEIQSRPKIAIDNTESTTTIVWTDERNSNQDVYMQSLTLSGQKIWINDIQVVGTVYNEHSVDIIFDSDNNFLISWVEDNEISQDIYVQKYNLDGSILWGSNQKIVSSTWDENYPVLGADEEGNFYLSWTKEEDGVKNVYLAKYDGSANLLWESRVNSGHEEANQYDSSVIYSDSYIYVTWTDERGGSQDVYAQKFDLAGNRMWLDDLRINMNTDNSSQSNSFLTLDASDFPLVCWSDDRGGDIDIYSSNFSLAGSYNLIPNVPFVITGAKKTYTEPDVFKYSANLMTDSSGKITINELEWDSYSIELEDGYELYDVVLVSPSHPISLQPGYDENAKIYLE